MKTHYENLLNGKNEKNQYRTSRSWTNRFRPL